MGQRNEDEPLQDEADRREEWRGGDTHLAPPAAGGNSLPASDDDDEGFGKGGGDAVAHPRAIAPPD